MIFVTIYGCSLKLVRFFMEYLTRKSGSNELFYDLYKRLFFHCAPVVRKLKPKRRIAKKNLDRDLSPDADDILVKSFIMTEEYARQYFN
jgi:hypothetical protein